MERWWKERTGGEVAVSETPGDHYSYLRADAPALAAAIGAWIDPSTPGTAA